MKLDDLKLMQKIDPDDMYHKIIHLPEQIMEAYNDANIHKPKKFNPDKNEIHRIVVCGMGGSAISGDLIKAAFQNIIPVDVVKDYTIPFVDSSTLAICCSYSGNTEETLSCFDDAGHKTSYLSAVTSGGQLKDKLDDSKVWVEIKGGNPPRTAIAHIFFSIVRILETFKIIPNQKENVDELIGEMVKKAGALANNVDFEKNLAKQTATKINNLIPVIYSVDPALAPIAYRWKCQINENSKYPAFSNVFPEMNHNEIEGWEDAKMRDKFFPIFLSDLKSNNLYQKRVKAFKNLLIKNNVEYSEFYSEGNSILTKFFVLIFLGDMISYYLAILRDTNPTSIDFIDYLKKSI